VVRLSDSGEKFAGFLPKNGTHASAPSAHSVPVAYSLDIEDISLHNNM